jgi:hypothetical protein
MATKITAPTGETGTTTRGSVYLLCTVAPADPGYAEGTIVYRRPKPARVIVLKGSDTLAVVQAARRKRGAGYGIAPSFIFNRVTGEVIS